MPPGNGVLTKKYGHSGFRGARPLGLSPVSADSVIIRDRALGPGLEAENLCIHSLSSPVAVAASGARGVQDSSE